MLEGGVSQGIGECSRGDKGNVKSVVGEGVRGYVGGCSRLCYCWIRELASGTISGYLRVSSK